VTDLRNNHVRVDQRRPSAQSICDRCGFAYQRSALAHQHEFAGAKLQNLKVLVCPTCMDQPNPNLRVYAPGADPLPIPDPRPENANMS
jgi:hypothetical protein